MDNPLLSLLGTVGDALDTPRRLLWEGALGPLQKLATGKDASNTSELLANLGMDPDSLLTKGLGLAGDVATDPLTYLGGALGKAAAGKAFKALGPRYGGGAAKLAGLVVPEAAQAHGGVGVLGHALASPEAKAILHEIPQGSTFLGSGAESLALATPEGDVLKLNRFDPRAAIATPEAEGVLQPTRRVVHGDVEVSRVPRAQGVGDQALYDAQAGPLRDRLAAQGLDVYDLKPEDMGLVGGRPTVIDPGSLDYLGTPRPFAPVLGRTPAAWLRRGAAAGAAVPAGSRLLAALGADPANPPF